MAALQAALFNTAISINTWLNGTLGCRQPTKDYVARRTAEGKTKTEIMRCLKRSVIREVFPHLLVTAPEQASDNREPVRAGLPG